jgi:Domain of unknown function (DUF4157)
MNAQAAVQTPILTKPTLIPVAHGLLQRCTATTECDECRKKREGMLQRAAVHSSHTYEVPPIVHEVLRSPGQPLDGETRAFMESNFAHDFSSVRVHTDAKAAESAGAVNALAYTVGQDIVFGVRQYAPSEGVGRRLMAHELTHVVQQAQNRNTWSQLSNMPPITMGTPGDTLEVEADQQAKNIENNRHARLVPERVHKGLLQRQTTKPPVRKGVTFVTKFHPGVAHNHAPTGRWADVQKDASSRCGKLEVDIGSEVRKGNLGKAAALSGLAGIECACASLSPGAVLAAARTTVMAGLSLAQKHLDHYISGGGANMMEDLEDVIKSDSGVRTKLAPAIKGAKKGHIRIGQSDYSERDFQYAFGAIDRLDYEVDTASGLAHVWFQDRYEWHPVGFGYKRLAGDSRRETNCVHAAAVEMKAFGAGDYWMTGDAVVPLSLITTGAGATSPGGSILDL